MRQSKENPETLERTQWIAHLVYGESKDGINHFSPTTDFLTITPCCHVGAFERCDLPGEVLGWSCSLLLAVVLVFEIVSCCILPNIIKANALLVLVPLSLFAVR